MRKYLSIISLAVAALLTGCGGGGAGGITPTPVATATPTIKPTATPPPVHRTISWRVVGTMNGDAATSSAQALRRRQTVTDATPVPVMAMLCDPVTGPYQDGAGSCKLNYDNNPVVVPNEVTPSPSPGASPAPEVTPSSITTTLTNGSLSTIPAGTPYLGVLYNSTAYSISTPQSTGLYSIIATYPDGSSGSIQLAVYPIFQTGCVTTTPIGYDLENGVATSDTANADVWWDCAAGVLHVPGGATLLPLSTPLASVLTTDWKNDWTEYDGQNTTPLTSIMVLRTRHGQIAKVFPYVAAYSRGAQIYELMGAYLVTTPPTEFTH